MGLSVRRIASAVPVAEVRELAVDWTRVVRGPVGAVLEAVDRQVVRGVIRIVVGAVERGREAKHERPEAFPSPS